MLPEGLTIISGATVSSLFWDFPLVLLDAVVFHTSRRLATHVLSHAFGGHSPRSHFAPPLLTFWRGHLPTGDARPVIPHLAGRARNAFDSGYQLSSGPNTEETQMEWIVQGTGEAVLTVDFQRAGVVTATVAVDGSANPTAAM